MGTAIRGSVLRCVRDTALEEFARSAYSFVFQRKGYRYDLWTVQVIERTLSVNSNCIDVGAYRGELLKHMLKVASKGRVFGFEPVDENYEFLRQRFPRAELFNVALAGMGPESSLPARREEGA